MRARRPSPIILNTLGDLTNRENRYASPRFANDFMHPDPANPGTYDRWRRTDSPTTPTATAVPDYWPTPLSPTSPHELVNEPPQSISQPLPGDTAPNCELPNTMAFPYVYPCAYSSPTRPASIGLGWIHSPDPSRTSRARSRAASAAQPLRRSTSATACRSLRLATQTWWGFPTWRETMSPFWTDPYQRVANAGRSRRA